MKGNAEVYLTKLIEKFEGGLTANRIKEYNEEATKPAFFQPLLKEVLGWEDGLEPATLGKSSAKEALDFAAKKLIEGSKK